MQGGNQSVNVKIVAFGGAAETAVEQAIRDAKRDTETKPETPGAVHAGFRHGNWRPAKNQKFTPWRFFAV